MITVSVFSSMQVQDKMQLLKAAVEHSDAAYKRPEAVKRLAGLLGLSGRSNEVSMCIGGAALLHGDVEAAQQVCLHLIRRDHVPAWRLCAGVMRAGGDEVGSTDTHVKLLSFAASYCPAKRVSLLCVMLGLLLLTVVMECHCAAAHEAMAWQFTLTATLVAVLFLPCTLCTLSAVLQTLHSTGPLCDSCKTMRTLDRWGRGEL